MDLKSTSIFRYSQFQDEYSLDDILGSPTVFGPLTKLQCCPTSDGSAAVVVASKDFVEKHGLQNQAVEILAMEMATDTPTTFNDNSCMKMVSATHPKFYTKQLYYRIKLVLFC